MKISGIISFTIKTVHVHDYSEPLAVQVQCGDTISETPYFPAPHKFNITMSFPDEADKFMNVDIKKLDGSVLTSGTFEVDLVRSTKSYMGTLALSKGEIHMDAMYVNAPSVYHDKAEIQLYHSIQDTPLKEIDALKKVTKAKLSLVPCSGLEPSWTTTLNFDVSNNTHRNIITKLTYKNQQIIQVQLMEDSGQIVASAMFDMWHSSQKAVENGTITSERRGYHTAEGPIAMLSSTGAFVGRIGLYVSLKEAEVIPPPPSKSKSISKSISKSKTLTSSSSSPSKSETSVVSQAVVAARAAESSSSSSSKRGAPSASSSEYYEESYEDSMLPTNDRDNIFNECKGFNIAIDDELERAKSAYQKGLNCNKIHAPHQALTAERLMAQVEQDLYKMEQVQWKSHKAVEGNSHLVYPNDLDELETYCRQHAVQARKMRNEIEKKVMRAIAEVTEDEAKLAKRAAHTCRAMAGHFKEKCDKVKCKETQQLVQKNNEITALAVDHAKDTKLAVKKARRCNLDDVTEKLEEAKHHRVLTEKRIDELDFNMAKYPAAMLKYNKKQEKKARLKEEAHLLACIEYEREISDERHRRYDEDMQRPRDTTYHEVSYHALRTATGNHDYQADDHHPADSVARRRREQHKNINQNVVRAHLLPQVTNFGDEEYAGAAQEEPVNQVAKKSIIGC